MQWLAGGESHVMPVHASAHPPFVHPLTHVSSVKVYSHAPALQLLDVL
jgi:hypothetical protein